MRSGRWRSPPSSLRPSSPPDDSNIASPSYEGAIEHLQRTIALDPLGLEAYMYLAQAYEAIGEPDLADAAVERAIRTGPENWQTYYDLGKFFYERHDWEQASGYFREVVRLLPESSVGYSALGSCLFYLGDRDQAREALERGVAIGSGYEGYNNLATLEFYDSRYRRGGDALRTGPRAGRLRPPGLDRSRRGPPIRRQRAGECSRGLSTGGRSGCRVASKPILRIQVLLIDLASLQLQLGQRTEAIAIIDRLPLDEVTAPDMMYSLAEIFEVLGERDEALAWIERALQTGYPLHVIEDYAAFEALRSDPRFRRLAETYAEPGPDTGVEISEEGEE